MGPPSAVTDYSDAKDFLDQIGQSVHTEVQSDAETYKDELKGSLSHVSTNAETANTADPCTFEYDKHTTLAKGNTKPCGNEGKEDINRFSDKQGAQCDDKKIEGNKGKESGACAPYRRLSLCNKNMVKMDTNNNDGKAKHDLLAEVCMAAKYEGQTITRDYPRYQQKYGDSGSTTCTMLARSFADIGDIVRGRDLYSGNKKKERLDENLKTIFKNIYEKLLEDNKTNGKKLALQKHYQDENGGNFFKLREDWWDANRETVWKAMTCSKELDNSSYFRATCDSADKKGPSVARNQCRCDGAKSANADQVPTYFDYVPQFLRWFEEWAEDFCRKKKIYVGIVKTYCRGPSGKEKYCSLNGCDCTQTVRAKGKLRYGNRCTDCLYACHRYEKWIDNQRKQFLKQKEQFDKQKNKYTDEINGTSRSNGGGDSRRQKRDASTTKYDGYESKFYKILKDDGNYSDVNKFLQKLSDEDVCQAVNDDKGGTIHFETVGTTTTIGENGVPSGASGTNDETKGTFYRSKYCQPCPICGMKKKDDGSGWEKKEETCKRGKLYKPKPGESGTPIEILKSGENHDDIAEKLKAFCAEKNGGGGSVGSGGPGGNGTGVGGGGNGEKEKLKEQWKCYEAQYVQKDKKEDEDDDEDDDINYVINAGGLCILKKEEQSEKKIESEGNSQKEPDEMQKTYNDFFYYWVAHMLKDSIYWRTQKLDKCINNTNGKQTKCRNGCHGKCDCFLKWVNRKRTEWDKIKEQFRKQKGFDSEGENGISVGGGLGMTADVVLEMALELEFSNQNSTEDAKNNVSAQEAEEIRHLRDIIKKKKQEEADGSPVTGKKKTLMDKLIDYEEDEAKKCVTDNPSNTCPKQQKKPKAPTTNPGGLARADSAESAEHDDDDDDDEDDEEDEKEEEEADAAVDEESSSPKVEVDGVNPCQIVKTLFTSDDLQNTFKDACEQKYAKNNSRLGWKCVTPSGDKTDTSDKGSEATDDRSVRGKRSAPDSVKTSGTNQGSICVPPRRRKLYVGKLEQWAKGTTEASVSSQAGSESRGTTSAKQSPSNSRADGLLQAFVESAAVETFFLWHKYKEEKKKEKKEANGDLFQRETSEDTEQNQLKSGNIPTDFLRQMFYTLGDYRDILVGNTGIVEAALSPSENEKMKEIEKKIKEHINNGSKSAVRKPGGQTPDKWWKENAQHIWNGMICALTYKENSSGGEKGTQQITQDKGLKEKLWDEDKKKPKNNGQQDYTYEKVELKEEVNGAKTASPSGEKTPLTDFISRPPYFRYLEEWGQNFCKERKKRLEKIKGECTEDGNGKKQKCSCYGEHCDDQLGDEPTNVSSLLCQDCGKHCSSYRKWIERKRTEYEKQRSAYGQQKEKCKTQSNGAGRNNDGNEFYKNLQEKYNDTAAFLQKLGPCKKDNSEDNGNDKLNFSQPKETFKQAHNCRPCSQFKIDCQKAKCTSGGINEKCNGNNKGTTTITAKDIIYDKNGNGNIEMRVSDNSPNGFEDDLDECVLGDCADAGIFKGFRKEQWECGKVCGYNVCKPENGNGKTTSGENNDQIITIRGLVAHWVQNFLEDYNKIKHKISHCKNSSEGYTCIKNCVEQWIKEKKEEWETIKKVYENQYGKEESDSDNHYSVRSVLEEVIPENHLVNGEKKLIKLSQFGNSCGCNAKASSTNGKNEDAIECMLDKLGEKATSCLSSTSGENPTQCQNLSPVEDDDDQPIEEENPVGKQQPSFCPKVETTEETVDEGKCEEDTVLPSPGRKDDSEKDEKKEESAADSGKETLVPKPPAAKKDKAPKPKPPQPDLPPALKNAMLSSTIMWSIGIGFAAFTYFFLKVNGSIYM